MKINKKNIKNLVFKLLGIPLTKITMKKTVFKNIFLTLNNRGIFDEYQNTLRSIDYWKISYHYLPKPH